MNILLDTNILFHLSKDLSFRLLTTIINPDNQIMYVSIVSIAELKSIAIQNNWGIKKLGSMFDVLNRVNIIEINLLRD
jgi:tRNA(fMet)-specific endonuclease VapC